MTKTPLIDALDNESYEWMLSNHPILLDAVQKEIAAGKTPDDIRKLALRHVGPERDGLVRRCEQVARYLVRVG